MTICVSQLGFRNKSEECLLVLSFTVSVNVHKCDFFFFIKKTN